MQLFSHLAQAGPSSGDIAGLVEQFQRVPAQIFSIDALKWVALSNVITIVVSWLSSNLLARENGRFTNALKLWGVYTLGGLILFILTVFAYMAAVASGLSIALLVVSIVATIIAAAILLGAPMLVYDLGFFRSIAFVLFSSLFVFVGEIVLRFFVPAPRGATELAEVMRKVTALPPGEQRRFIEALSQSVARGSLPPAPEVIVADQSKSITERQAALRIMRANLEKRRIELKWGDQGMLEAYNRDKARYDELAKELKEPAPH